MQSPTITQVTPASDAPSRSQVDKAASRIRKWLRGEMDASDPRIDSALEVIFAFRAQHSNPLVKANNGLRSMIRSEGLPIEVSQRLKRFPTILDKLAREPTLPLSKMQDIGGVRAILGNVAQVRAVETRLKRRRPVLGYSDYIGCPRASGYRGVHVVVDYDGRRIEVQLRTYVMHQWAVTVERLSSRRGTNYKQDGDSPIQNLMAVISQAMAIEEDGGSVPPEILATMGRLRLDAGLGQG